MYNSSAALYTYGRVLVGGSNPHVGYVLANATELITSAMPAGLLKGDVAAGFKSRRRLKIAVALGREAGCGSRTSPDAAQYDLVVGNERNDELKVDTLKDIGMMIIEKCDGLPLAVKVIGGLLRQKKTIRSDWENVLNDSTWSVSLMPEELNYAVYLSYQDLHHELKSCFVHYAHLPKRTMFRDNLVVAMWISEGYVHGNSHNLEILGKQYYGELIARNLLVPDQQYVDQTVCNMHDVVRSFAQYIARDEAVIAYESEASLTNKINPQSVIHISLNTKGQKSNELEWSSLRAHISLRTLILVGETKINLGDSLSSFPCLRTLHIEDGNFDALSKSLVQLKHLRYLCLDCTDTSKLPAEIAKMKFLQSGTKPEKNLARAKQKSMANYLYYGHSQ